MRLRAALALLAAAATQPAFAADPAQAGWAGVWQGTIGALPVRVCLADNGSWQFGSYYYLAHLRPITLAHGDDGGWSEDAPKGQQPARWTLAGAGTDRLTGTWRHGERALPVALARVGSKSDQDDACGSRAYIAPRLGPIAVTRAARHRGGFAYTELTYHAPPSFSDITLASFAFPATQPGDRTINAALALDPGKADGPADWISCMSGALGQGMDGDFVYTLTPKTITARWMTVQENSGGYCGGAHPDYAYDWVQFDRRSGQRIHLGRWFGSGRDAAASDTVELPAGLRRLAVRRMKPVDKDCAEAVGEADFWSLGLGAGGLILTPSLPHVVAACVDDAVVPYAALGPFLTAAGKAEMARLGLR